MIKGDVVIKRDKHIRGGVAKTQIRVVESYRPGAGQNPKMRTIRAFGYLEDQEDQTAFMAMVEEFNRNYKAENTPLRIEAESTARMYSSENRRMNYGYKFLESVYDFLDINRFIAEHLRASGFKGTYAAAEIFKFLVLLRILSPDSKRASFQMKDGFYGLNTDFDLQDVYRFLEKIADFEVGLQRHLNEVIKKKVGRDLSHAFYDVTNYFFEIDFPDGDDDLRRRGVSKEHRIDPITAMGLFIDSNGLPVSMSIFPGNTSDTLTLLPTMRDVKNAYGLGRLVVVADKGVNSSKNIDAIQNAGDGYAFSQILRGKKGQRYHEALFDQAGWTVSADETYRTKLITEDYPGYDEQGNRVTRKRKALLYWNKAEAEMARRKRDEKLKRAARAVKNNVYGIKKGVEEYTKENIIDKETGEVLEDTVTIRTVDLEKAEKDARFDGYFCIVTSELDYSEGQIRQTYGGLWRIEQSFRLLKSDLYARPVFVSKNEHIRAHFMICFVSLLIVRIVQYRMGRDALSAERIARALNAATCREFKGGMIHLDDVGGAFAFKKRKNKQGKWVDTLAYSGEDEIALDYRRIQQLFSTDCYSIHLRKETFHKFLKSIAVALQ